MKKSVLALSITAAVAALGFAGGAQAMTGTLGGAAPLTELYLAENGVGHALLVPYFTAQADNATLFNIVNTDTVRGKAVKIRFRGAANSDDIYDFQVFMSPGDVWTANISKGADGRAKLTTGDATCTKPSKAVLNATPFVTARLDPTLTTDGKANHTREGYIEIFNMADIPPTGTAATPSQMDDPLAATAGNGAANPLYTAIKHAAGVAPCSGAAWTALDTTNMQWNAGAATPTTPRAMGMLPPTTGLFVNWTIINVVGAAAWSRDAVAIIAGTSALTPTTGNVVYWPQTSDPVGAPAINGFTADALLRSTAVYTSAAVITADPTPAVAAAFYDLPDMSTPYAAGSNPLVQAARLTTAISATSATNEYLTDTAISASTDWVFSMPTRRYSMALDYAAIAGADDGRRFTDLFGSLGVTGSVPDGSFNIAYFNTANTLVSARQICVRNITPQVWNREEGSLTAATDVVVSPSSPADPLSFCGEASVLSINNGGVSAGSGALKASVALKDLDVTYRDGWMRLNTPAATPATLATAGAVPGTYGTGLPVLGSAFSRAWAGANSFGATWQHRFTR